MNRHSMIATVLGGAATLCCFSMMATSASAQSLGSSWTYRYDAFGDGSGGSAFDIKGMAMRDTGDRLFVAFTGGASITGVSYSGAADGNIGWGDLFFNFSGKNFKEAEATGQLFGVRFAGTNDSNVATGVYSGVKTTSVTGQNSGYSSLQQYYDYGWGKANTQGTALSTQAAASNYYGTGAIQTSIASGTKVADIATLFGADLSATGLRFQNAGSQTFGFSFAKSALPTGNFLASIFMECGNDGMAYSASAVPEPTTMAGVALAGAGLAAYRRRRNKSAKSA